ncbi:MAG TPA: FtsX-like permease family protein, partial [Chitinophagaceae bacterium]|nr:FtsX-like permease family protein [Chitinophagaceae bacterium]
TIKNAELKNLKKLENEQEAIARNPQVFLLPMSDWHLHSIDRKAAIDDKPVRMVWMVSIIGMFVLLLACINFMNLSTARSEKRAKEVGIRKTIGSMRKQLVFQFFSESFLVVIFSFIISCVLATLLLPWFNNLSDKEMTLPLNNFYFWLITGAFIFITGLLAGSYPALYLSSFKPIKVLKGTFHTGLLASLPRKILVVMQFTVSVALIICTVVVYRQLQFARNRPVGYDREGLIMVDMRSDDFYGKYDLLRSELFNTGVVSNMSESMGMLTELVSGNDGFDWKGRNPNKNESFGTLAVTHEHGETIGWKFIAGRDFSRKFISDSSGVVINEAAEKYLELKNPVGEVITWKWKDNKPVPYTILGVIKNMVMESPYEAVEPTMFFIKPLNGGVSCINIRVKPGVTMNTALPRIEAVFKKNIPSVPFEYKFADKEYAQKFATEERTGKLAGFFAVLAIFISCLGLFGMASFMTEQRTKEIGVRKVLGASVFNLWSLLSRQFVLLVVFSFFIAAPIAFYFMNNWLQNYQYRTELSWWIFAAAGSASLLITLLTVSFQSIKAAVANPVKSLRTE